MVGGGGGKNISSIIITGLESTDTITCTKDGKSYSATWDATAQHWEIVGLPLGTFIVTATNGTKTITETVLIDITGVYEIEMSFTLWLYRDGDECEDITGGWIANNISNLTGRQNGSVTKNEDSVYLDGSGYTAASIVTSKKISKTGYEKIFLKTISQSGYSARIRGMSINSGADSNDAIYFVSDDHIASTGETVSVDITSSSIPNEFYVLCFSAGNSTSTVTQIWLE